MRRIIATVAATVLAIGLAGVSSAQGAPQPPPPPPPPPGHGAYTPPPIQWGQCSDSTLQAFGAQCGMLVVPLDYAHPNGTKIELAVSRILHTVPASQYQGVMLVNPGGPGGSGLIYSVFQSFIPNGAGFAYDWIGFDPRGVGASQPSLACDDTVTNGPRPPYNPSTTTILNQWVARSKSYAQACGQAAGAELLDHVKTTDSVADMESLRIALGQQKLNYYGFSYGTYLGSVYMTLHPDQVGRFVLDSTVDPRGVWYRDNQDQDVAFQTTIEAYFSYLAQHDEAYDVGATPQDVESTFVATQAALDAHPADGVFGGDELVDVFTQAAYYVYGWTDIAQAYSDYLHSGDASELKDLYGPPGTPGSDNSYAMYLATSCTDAKWPQDQNKLNHDNTKLNQDYPFLTWPNAWFNGPCAYWSGQAGNPVNVDGKKVKVPVLMFDETYDPATPYSGSLYVRSKFPTASLIEGLDGTTHAATLSGVPCVDDAIAQYLTDGTVPPRTKGNHSDLVCPAVPAPEPSSSSTSSSLAPQAQASSVRQRALARLRAGIEEYALH